MGGKNKNNETNKLHLCLMDRTIEVYGNHFWEFFEGLSDSVREKLDYVFQMIISFERVPSKFFKHIDDGIYEIRVRSEGNIYRVFCFQEKGKLVILLHGFQKKTQKLPRREILKAKQLRQMYYDEKRQS